MPARIVLVHDDAAFVEDVSAALQDAGYSSVEAFTDSMSALDALDMAQLVELLITRVQFPEGKPNGVSLARMARVRRSAIKVLFTANPEMQAHTLGLGEFLPLPVTAADVVAAVHKMLAPEGEVGSG